MTQGATHALRLLWATLLALTGALVPAAAAVSQDAGGAKSARPAHRWRSAALDRPVHTRTWKIRYRAHTGRMRDAYVLLPRSYGPQSRPPLPLVISPHGRGVDGAANARVWGDLPGIGGFAVVNPDGEGNHLGS